MRKRNRRMEIYLTDGELAAVERKAKKAGLSREGYGRAALLNMEVREAPSADTQQILWELRRGGANLNQAIQKMHTLGLADIPLLSEAAEQLYEAGQALTEAYTKPFV